ncbi:PREDICTED: U-box domain-containing protein 33-like [Ipomoea nil]|uniref:U-box domain-containing protein 33-like n=1 Tax=Ipomoea nil TaxID=35883 RepID=UPI000901ADD9|nr:PREDICTED: U-box domain-containing protein 33-like [Ipomoea nil]
MEMKTSRRSSPEEANNNKVYVAVGKKSFEKAVVLLQWACRTFGNSEICILHVHQPSSWIPTPVGRLPASKANVEVVSAFRNEEREVMRKRLYNYLNVCSQFKVKTSTITTEAGEVQKGIVDLVKEHNIRKLVIGAIPDSMKAKKRSRKASYVARNAPLFSEILFVYKGKLVFTRKSCQFPKSAAEAQSQFSCNNEAVFVPKSPGSTSVNHRKSHGRGEGAYLNGAIDEFTKDSSELVEFSFSDLQIATCNFSESFKIGESGYGAVYKGELLDRTVVIKKLHTHNLQWQSEFLQQVEVLGKLHHHHLVTLLGICPESWSLISEYLPGGNLHDRLFPRTNIRRFLSWKTRTKIVADIAKGLLFLHSEKIVHGNLKPENILIGPDNTCKICDFGIYRLVMPQTLRCPSFARLTEPKGVFSYTDPEFLATGNLTPKSDIYSFGLVILEILTRRALPGLSSEVHRALVSGNLESVLDSSAGEWPAFVARKLAHLGINCCELNSRDRPELTPSIVNELESFN